MTTLLLRGDCCLPGKCLASRRASAWRPGVVAVFVLLAASIGSPGARADWVGEFSLSTAAGFDHVQVVMVAGELAEPAMAIVSTDPPGAASDWQQSFDNGLLLLADNGGGTLTTAMEFELSFVGDGTLPAAFCLQAWLDEELQAESAYTWDGAAWSVEAGSAWADVRLDTTMATPFEAMGDLNLVPDANAYDVGDEVVVSIELSGISDSQYAIVGGQFFLAFDTGRLAFVSASVGDYPWSIEFYEASDGGAGTVDYAVGASPFDPGATAGTLAVLRFEALAAVSDGAALVTFRNNNPPTVISASANGSLIPMQWEMAAITIGAACPEDLDGDGSVGLADLQILLSHYGETGASPADGDLTGDGSVGLADLQLLLAGYGGVC